MQNTYGYIRVSSRDQNEDRQLMALHKVGVKPGNSSVINNFGKTMKSAMPDYSYMEGESL